MTHEHHGPVHQGRHIVHKFSSTGLHIRKLEKLAHFLFTFHYTGGESDIRAQREGTRLGTTRHAGTYHRHFDQHGRQILILQQLATRRYPTVRHHRHPQPQAGRPGVRQWKSRQRWAGEGGKHVRVCSTGPSLHGREARVRRSTDDPVEFGR